MEVPVISESGSRLSGGSWKAVVDSMGTIDKLPISYVLRHCAP